MTDLLKALRQAFDSPVEPVALGWYRELCTEPVKYSFSFGAICPNIYDKWKPLYTTPPSLDALIAEAIEKHDEKNVLIKTVNMRTNAQPYLDALIADLMELHLTWEDYQDVKEVCDKYRRTK